MQQQLEALRLEEERKKKEEEEKIRALEEAENRRLEKVRYSIRFPNKTFIPVAGKFK